MAVYRGLGRVQSSIEAQSDRLTALVDPLSNSVDIHHVAGALGALLVQVTEQLDTVNDAMADWRDLAPLEVQAIEDKAKEGESVWVST